MMRVLGWTALAFGLVLVACGGDDDPNTKGRDQTTTLQGTLTGAAESGQLEIRVSSEVQASDHLLVAGHTTPLPAGARSAHGTIVWPDQSSLALSGQVLDSTLTLSGGGFDLTGPWSESGVVGTYTGPNGPGSFTVGPAEM